MRTPEGLSTLYSAVRKVSRIYFVFLGYAAVLSVLAFNKLYQFKVQSYDLAIFNQVFWNSLHGRFMYSLPECCVGPNPSTFLGTHFSPLIVLLLPLYFLYESPYALLAIQSVALAAPSIVLYRLGLKWIGKLGGSVVVISYMVYPGLLWVNLSDFHLEAFIPLAYVLVFYSWLQGYRVRLILSFFFLLSIIEFAAIIGLAFLAYAWIKKNGFRIKKLDSNNLLLIGLGAVSILWYIVANLVISANWPQKGTFSPSIWSPSSVVIDPQLKALYWIILLIPLGFFPLLAPIDLVGAFPWFFGSIFSNYSPYYVIIWQYPAIVVSQLFIAALAALKRIRENARIVRLIPFQTMLKTIVVLSLISVVTISPFGVYAYEHYPTFGPGLPDSHSFAGHQALSVIPSNASVLAENDLLTYLVQRTAPVYSLYPLDIGPPQYIAVDITQDYYFFHDPSYDPLAEQLQYFTSLYSYGLIASADGYLVYKLGYHSVPQVFVPFRAFFQGTNFNFQAPISSRGSSLFVPLGYQGVAWNGPWIALGPGNYTITFVIVNDAPPNSTAISLDAIYYANQQVLGQRLVNGTDRGPTAESLTISLSGFIPAMEFRGIVQRGQSGNIYFNGLNIVQVGAP